MCYLSGRMLADVVALSEAHALAVWQNVVIQIWEGPTDPPTTRREMQKTLATFKRVRRAVADGGLLAFSVISERAAMPDPESRAIASSFPSYFDYYVGVHEGPEHRSALVRTAIGAMALQARVEPRYELVADVRTACRCLAARSDGGFRAIELAAVVSELRTRIASS